MFRPKVFKLFNAQKYEQIYNLDERKLSKVDNKHTNLKKNIIKGFGIIHYSIFLNNEPLALYIMNRYKNAIRKIIKQKFSYHGYVFYKGADLLSICCLSENILLTNFILQKFKEKEFKITFDRNNQSCLHSSAFFSTMGAKVISSDLFLVKNLVSVQNLDYDNPLHISIRTENADFLTKIYQHLMNSPGVLKNLRIAMLQMNKNSQTPWELSQAINSKEIVGLMYKIRRICNFVNDNKGTQLNTDDNVIFIEKTEDVASMILEGDIYVVQNEN